MIERTYCRRTHGRWLALWVLVLGAIPAALSAAPTSAQAPASAPASSPLAQRIQAYLAQPRFASANWGISVVALDSGRTVYAHRADKLGVPASNAKLYTAALALATLGPTHRTRTTLYASAAPHNGRIDGDLILYGRGDPTLGNPDDANAAVHWARRMAEAVARRGITHVRGALIADDTWFTGPRIPAGWEAGDLQTWYAPPASALTTGSNLFHVSVGPNKGLCCQVTTRPAMPDLAIINLTQTDPNADAGDLGLYRPAGSRRLYIYGGMPPDAKARHFVLSAPDPALLAGHALLQALTARGIRVDGGVRALHWPRQDAAIGAPGTIVLSRIQSPPLRAVVRHALKHSDNLYAQLLLLQTGVEAARQGDCPDRARAPRTTGQWARCAQRSLLRRIGVDYGQARFVEGSGLSRQDLVTPAATTTLLVWAARQPFARAFRDALPVAGVDGTLKWRMRKTVAAGNLSAKTGTLSYNYTLSGYVTDAAGKPLAFSLMLNDYARPLTKGGYHARPSPQSDLDAIATLIANHGAQAATQ